MSAEETKQMNIASCRICLLSKSNCASCPLSWALKEIEAEKPKIEDLFHEYFMETMDEFDRMRLGLEFD